MNKAKWLLAGILLLAGVLRFVNLGHLPNGFIPEEVSTGWNAYSLLKTGRDEWGTFLPIIFRETGGYKLVLNSYLIVPVMAILGPNELAVRTPVALAGVLAVLGTYFLVDHILKNKKIALISALLLAVSPWHISMGRYSVDVNWGIPLFVFGLWLLLKSFEKPHLRLWSGVLFALTYYTYFNYDVFTWLFLFGFGVLYRKLLWQASSRKYTILFVVIQVIGILPYAVTPTLFTRFSQATSVDAIGFINRINEHRGACVVYYPQPICKLIYNKATERVYEFTRNWTNHYSTTTLFLYGSKLGLSGMPDRWGFLYVFEFPLMILGLLWLGIRRKFFPFLVLWGLLFGVGGSLASEGHVWRMLTLLPLPQILAGVGFWYVTARWRKWGVPLGLGLLLAVSVFRFWADYTSFFPYTQAPNSYYGFRDVYAYVSPLESQYKYIVVAPTGLGFEQLYIYYLFYMRPDPRSYQLGIDVERPVGAQNWVQVKQIGKWHFEQDIRNIANQLPDQVLVVTDGQYKDTEVLTVSSDKILQPTLLKTIYYPNGDPAFKIFDYTLNEKI